MNIKEAGQVVVKVGEHAGKSLGVLAFTDVKLLIPIAAGDVHDEDVRHAATLLLKELGEPVPGTNAKIVVCQFPENVLADVIRSLREKEEEWSSTPTTASLGPYNGPVPGAWNYRNYTITAVVTRAGELALSLKQSGKPRTFVLKYSKAELESLKKNPMNGTYAGVLGRHTPINIDTLFRLTPTYRPTDGMLANQSLYQDPRMMQIETERPPPGTRWAGQGLTE